MIAYDRLSQIIPADQALANKALTIALQQVTGISSMSLPTFANAVAQVSTTKNLPLVNALTTAVPSSTANFYINTLGTGSATNTTLEIVNFLGTAGGWISTEALANTVATFTTMNLTYLTTIYDTMLGVVDGEYDETVPPVPPETEPTTEVVIPPGTPGAGTYASRDDAVSTGLIPVATTEIGNVVAAYPTQTSTLNSDWNAMVQQITTENSLQSAANLVWSELLSNDQSSVLGFISSLPSYGLKTEVGGMAQFLELVSDLTTLSGQAVVGTLRQGRNQTELSASGVGTAITIPDTQNPPPDQATLLPSTYTN